MSKFEHVRSIASYKTWVDTLRLSSPSPLWVNSTVDTIRALLYSIDRLSFRQRAGLHLMENGGGMSHRFTTLSFASFVVDVRVALRVIDVVVEVTFYSSICRVHFSRARFWHQMTIRLPLDFAASASRYCYVLWDVGITACWWGSSSECKRGFAMSDDWRGNLEVKRRQSCHVRITEQHIVWLELG